MPQHDANESDRCSLTIAGVHFTLSGPLNLSAFAPPFQVFLNSGSPADLGCEVVCVGPDDALASQANASNEPWLFKVREGLCELVRRNQEGEVLWRIAGPLAFNRATVTWNPRRFADYYGSYERSWSTGLGLSLLALRLREQGGLVLHGTAAEVDGQGIVCMGISGRGKSTLARLLDASGATVLTDERPVLRQWPASGAGANPSASFRVYGSPWPSSAGFARNRGAPLRRLYFLEHGESDRITPLSPFEAVRRLIHVATIPWQDPILLDPFLATVDALLNVIPCAVLSFRPTPAVVDVIQADLRRSAGGT